MTSTRLIAVLLSGAGVGSVASGGALAQTAPNAATETQNSSSAVADSAGQDRPSTEAQAGENDIVVTGIRESLRSAAQQKRNAVQVIDAITSEDIGKFPTENVADASQRITGVQIVRTRGVGTAASIRGLPPTFTRVELNGSTLASGLADIAGGISRSFDFRTLPTEFVRTLEVTKSPTADMLEGGLSGTINVKTVRPLEIGRTLVTGSAMGVANMNDGKVTPRLGGLVSTTLLDNRLGVLLTGGYDETQTESHNNGIDGWNTQREAAFAKDFNSDGDLNDVFNVPSQVRTEILRERRRRLTLASIIEYKVGDGVKLYAEGFYSNLKVKVNDLQNLHIFSTATGRVYDSSTTKFTNIAGIDPSQVTANIPFATTIGLSGTDTRALDRVYDLRSRTYYGKAGIELEFGPWSGNVQFAYSNGKQTADGLGMPKIARFDVTAACVQGDKVCGITLSPDSQRRYLDPDQATVASINGWFGRENRDRVSELTFDAAREFDDSIISRISVGGAASWRKVFSTTPNLVVSGTAVAGLLNLQRSQAQPAGFSAAPYTLLVEAGRGGFLDHYNGPASFPTSWVSSDTEKAVNVIGRDKLLAAGTLQPNLNQIVDLGENSLAGYAMMGFGRAGDAVTGNVGLRVVRTSARSAGFAPDFSQIRILVDAGGIVSAPAAGAASTKNSYTEFLPSANLKLNVTDNFLLRFGASRTLSRPNLVDVTPSTAITGVGSNFTISAGNPDLKPFISLNFDFTAEWYPSPDTSLTLALFTKDLSTLVRPITTTVMLPVSFYSAATNTTVVRDQVFQRVIPTNQNGVILKGAEFGFQQAFTFLPGLLSHTGMQANYTFISNSDPQVLTAASRNNFNVSAFYENAGLALRGSYTWRDRFVSTGLPDGFFGLGITTRPRGNLDLNVTYAVTENVSILMEGSNVLHNSDASSTTLGNLPVAYLDSGAQYLAGFRVRF